MKTFFSELSKQYKKPAFEKFLISVLQQKALKNGKEIKFNKELISRGNDSQKFNKVYVF